MLPREVRPGAAGGREQRHPDPGRVSGRAHFHCAAALRDEIRASRAAAVQPKAIQATDKLGTLCNMARGSLEAMMAGVDFIRISTGKLPLNAAPPASFVVPRVIRIFAAATGPRGGLKPAGGISKAKDASLYLVVVKEEPGEAGLRPEMFRFGAPGLPGDIERELEHVGSGR